MSTLVSKLRTHCAISDKPIVLRDVSGNDGRRAGCYKPAGFWYEVDGDWQRWCEAESFGCGDYMFSLNLADCNVLQIETLFALDLFHEKFYSEQTRYSGSIQWERVKQLYDGVEIAPYQWERRLSRDYMWYYGWDCAAGVIWRPRNATVEYLGVRASRVAPEKAKRCHSDVLRRK